MIESVPQSSDSQTKPVASQPSLLRAAGLMGIATFLSRIMGLVREQAFAILFGAGHATDAFNIAFRIPNLLRDLFAEGAMSSALIPTFTRARHEGGERQAWRVAGLVFRVLFVSVSIIAIFGIVFSEQLVSLYASAFRDIPGKFELTVRMTRVMFLFFPLVALAAGFMGVLNACGVFFLPAFASALFNIASVTTGVAASLYLFKHGEALGITPIEGMALGVVVGGAVQAFCQLPALRKVGYRWQPKAPEDPVWHKDSRLKTMLRMMIPGTVGLGATQINILVNSVLATSQGAGAVSWLNYAFRLMQFPIGVFGVSLASATLPRLSTHWVQKDLSAFSTTLTQALRQAFAINLPASAGLAFLSYPIIQLIFEYGRFSERDTEATAKALIMYSVGLAAYSAVKILVRACYAMGNTRVPVVSSIATVVLTILLNVVLVDRFGYWALALGTSIGAIFNAAYLGVAVRGLIQRSGGTFPFSPILRALAANSIAAALMGAACSWSYQLLEAGISGSLTGSVLADRLLKVSLLTAEGVVVLLLIARLAGLVEILQVVDIFTNKLKNKLRRGRT